MTVQHARRKPRVVLLRGHNANVWDLRPFEALMDDYELSVLVTGSNLHRLDGLAMPTVPSSSPRDRLPAGRFAGAAAYVIGERYLGLRERLAGADIVHAAEIGSWFSAQAAALKRQLGFRLVVTVWETLPARRTFRWPRERGYRDRVLAECDVYLPTTERARDGLLLEGAPAERIRVCPPGIALDRFRRPEPPVEPPSSHTVLSAGRLVWEKGHQDVLRAVAALRGGLAGAPRDDVRALIVGDGPEGSRLRAYARELGLGDAIEFRATVPYHEMPALFHAASALVLASLPVRGWEEQFGMVLVEAMAAGTPIVATTTGAIPEVIGDAAASRVPAGDWRGIAEALASGPLACPPAQPAAYDSARLDRFSIEAAARRVQAVYAEALRT